MGPPKQNELQFDLSWPLPKQGHVCSGALEFQGDRIDRACMITKLGLAWLAMLSAMPSLAQLGSQKQDD